MYLEETPKLARMTFRNYTEALHYANDHKMVASNATTFGACGLNSDNSEFYGSKTWDEAYKLATTGWLEGAKNVLKFRSKLDVTGQVQRPEIYFDVVGEHGIDMGRYMSGEPECMISQRYGDEVERSPKQVKLYVNVSTQAGVDKTTISRRGAAVIGLIEALETAGVRVELHAVKINSGDNSNSIFIDMPLKHADESLQLDQIAFALCHEASNRRIGFSLCRMCGEIGRRISEENSYGGESKYVPKCDIFLGRLNYGSEFNSDESAINWIKSELRKIGVKLVGEN